MFNFQTIIQLISEDFSNAPAYYCKYADATWFDLRLRIILYGFAFILCTVDSYYYAVKFSDVDFATWKVFRKAIFSKVNFIILFLTHASLAVGLSVLGVFSHLDEFTSPFHTVGVYIVLRVVSFELWNIVFILFLFFLNRCGTERTSQL